MKTGFGKIKLRRAGRRPCFTRPYETSSPASSSLNSGIYTALWYCVKRIGTTFSVYRTRRHWFCWRVRLWL